jgi:5-methylcytosine-specific restriction protein A
VNAEEDMPTLEELTLEAKAQISRAAHQRRSHIEINAGELHRTLKGRPSHSDQMRTACDALQSLMSPKDAIVFQPQRGYGSSFTVRFVLFSVFCVFIFAFIEVTPAFAQKNSWKLVAKEDPLTDEKTAVAVIFDDKGDTMAAMLCTKGIFAFQVGKEGIGRYGIETVQWRVDREPIVREQWISQNGFVTAVGSYAQTGSAKIAAAQSRFVISIFGETYVFPVVGAAKALKEIGIHCPYALGDLLNPKNSNG